MNDVVLGAGLSFSWVSLIAKRISWKSHHKVTGMNTMDASLIPSRTKDESQPSLTALDVPIRNKGPSDAHSPGHSPALLRSLSLGRFPLAAILRGSRH